MVSFGIFNNRTSSVTVPTLMMTFEPRSGAEEVSLIIFDKETGGRLETVVAGIAETAADKGVREVQLAFRPRDSHVKQTPFFLFAIVAFRGTGRGE